MRHFVKRLLCVGLVLAGGYALWQEMIQEGRVVWGALLYFTIQSNLLAVLYLASLLLPGKSPGRWDSLLGGGILTALLITAAAYNFFLYNIFLDWGTVGYTCSRSILHIVLPAGFLLHWLLFAPHGRLRLRHAAAWCLYPLAYGGASLLAAHATGWSLYFFLGAGQWKDLLVVAGLFLLLCLSVVAADCALAHRKRGRPGTRSQ